MAEKARDYKQTTKKRLFILSNNKCYNPTCNKKLISSIDKESIIAKIAHIEAASENGPRYRADMTDDERRHFNNLILLCDECHIVIDNKANEGKYPVELLQEWKKEHEDESMNLITRNSSYLGMIIDAIADADIDSCEFKTDTSLNSYSVENKIKFNSLKRNRSTIEVYNSYSSKLSTLYKELEEEGSFKKENLLRNINLLYLKVKGKYVEDSDDPISVIQENADNIFEDVEEELLLIVEKDRIKEDVTFGTSLIMADAFIRCKILEEPPAV
ncbi:MAG: hypothetical protein JXR90_13000 [Spirochaetes bacterium]|nr:hypothetical protein [Spirochaetota bacterium]